MDELISNLLMYGKTAEHSVLATLAELEDARKRGMPLRAAERKRAYRAVRELLELATEYGFNDNLWQNYLSFLLMMDENPFTLTAEKVGAGEGSVNRFVERDFHIFRALFRYDFGALERALGTDCFSVSTDYRALPKQSHIVSHGHFSSITQNAAIPPTQIQGLKKLQGNYVRNW